MNFFAICCCSISAFAFSGWLARFFSSPAWQVFHALILFCTFVDSLFVFFRFFIFFCISLQHSPAGWIAQLSGQGKGSEISNYTLAMPGGSTIATFFCFNSLNWVSVTVYNHFCVLLTAFCR